MVAGYDQTAPFVPVCDCRFPEEGGEPRNDTETGVKVAVMSLTAADKTAALIIRV